MTEEQRSYAKQIRVPATERNLVGALLSWGFAGALAVSAAACSSPDNETARRGEPGGAVGQTDPAAASRGHARIAVAVEVSGPNPVVTGAARFLRYRDVDAETADLLTGAARPAPELGGCAVARDDLVEDTLGGLAERGLVHHADAGDLVFSLGGMAAETVTPSDVSPLFPYVTGVEYPELAVAIGLDTGWPEGADVAVTGFGGERVGPFDVVATLPPLPGDVSVDFDAAEVAVTWERAAVGAASRDAELVLGFQRDPGQTQVRCRVRDDGHFVVARSVVDGLVGAEDGLIVTVERIRRVPFTAAGLDWGELEAAVRYVVDASAPRE